MKLREVTHTEKFCGEETTDKFSIYNNRFILFDKLGRQLNEWRVADMPNYLNLKVIEVKNSGYQSGVYFVGFPTTHIKLDILDEKLLCGKLKFGEVEEE